MHINEGRDGAIGQRLLTATDKAWRVVYERTMFCSGHNAPNLFHRQ
jgi:hypothetical protein